VQSWNKSGDRKALFELMCDEDVTKQQRLQSKSSAHVQHKLSVLWKQYRAGTRSVDGLLRACICQCDCSLRYNRQIIQTRIYCKTV